jgi:hypothetical protein
MSLGEKHPGQHQVFGLASVRCLIVHAEATLFGPAGSAGHIALGQPQVRTLRRDRIEQAGRARRQLGLGQKQPGTASDKGGREGREPLLDRRHLATQTVDRIEMAFNQPGGPVGLFGSDRMADGVIG